MAADGLKAAGVALASYVACLALAVVALLVTGVVSAHWGAGRTGNAMLVMICADAALFLLSAVVVFFALARWLSALPRLLVCGVYLLAGAATLAGLFVVSAIVLDR